MVMDEGLDTGDMLLKEETVISDEETSGTLHDRLSLIGANLLVQTLEGLFSGTITRKKQNNEESTYAPMIKKSLSTIDWNKSAKDVHNLVRGLQPWPVASTVYQGKVLKIHQTKVFEQQGGKPGEIMSVDPFVVGCADGTALELLEVQYEGKKRMKSQDFIRGNKIETETMLGGTD